MVFLATEEKTSLAGCLRKVWTWSDIKLGFSWCIWLPRLPLARTRRQCLEGASLPVLLAPTLMAFQRTGKTSLTGPMSTPILC